MKTTAQPPLPTTRNLARRLAPRLAPLPISLSVCLCLTGCFGFLKPAQSMARHFVLAPLPATYSTNSTATGLGVGVGPVKLPAYLFETSFAVRREASEIDYLPTLIWAERLDTGMQRVLAANLSTLLPTDQIRLSAWQRQDVSAEVYLVVERFDVSVDGQGVLVAWWHVRSPGGATLLKSGECRASREGPPPAINPSGAVATLSELLADLSRQVADAIKETASASR